MSVSVEVSYPQICKHCRFWDGSISGFGYCKKITTDDGPDALACIPELDQGDALFLTRAVFGCVQWEQKPL